MRRLVLLAGTLLALGVPAAAHAEPTGSNQLKLPSPAEGQVSAALIQTAGVPKPKALKPAADVLSLVQSGKPKSGKVQTLVVAANLRIAAVKPKPPALTLARSLLAPSKELANGLTKPTAAKKLCPAAVLAGKPKLTSTAGLPKATAQVLAGMLVRVLCGTGSSFDQFILILVGLDVPGFVFPSEPTPPGADGAGTDPAPADPGTPVDPSDPPDPPEPPFAPPLPPGVPTSLYDATSFLYTGANPVQTGVSDGAIDPDKVAVLRGEVFDTDFEPLGNVTISILDHPEYGLTHTDEKGGFDMAVNGGGPVTLVFERDGYISIQRTVEPPWRDYLIAEPVALTRWDPAVTTVDSDSGAAFQVAQGTESEDLDGTRQATLLFPEGADATMELPDGSTQPLNGLMNVRATEYTVGDSGTAAMPGELPPNSGYTYAVEFSVDQAEAAGATDVRFDEPIINYTENFVGAPVGSPVPTGYYDEERAQWVPAKNGFVIKVVSETAGLADLDITGDGAADSAGALAAKGITEAERARLANLYDPPQELWRVEITHFTPWDHNWPYGPPPGARPPKLPEFKWKDPKDPCPRSILSTVGCETQTVNETIPVTGTPYELVYQNDRTLGWTADDFVSVPVTGSTLPPGLGMIRLTMDIQGQRSVQTWCDSEYATYPAPPWDEARAKCDALPDVGPNISAPVVWDGLDGYGRPVQGRPKATIELEYMYQPYWFLANASRERAFAAASANTGQPLTFRRDCTTTPPSYRIQFIDGSPEFPNCMIAMATTATRTLGNWDALPASGLGGWALDVHHGYDPVDGSLNLGSGQTVRSELVGATVSHIAGGGTGGSGNPVNGGSPLKYSIDYLQDIDRGPDGSIYILRDYCFGNAGRILRISPDGEHMDVYADNRTCSGPGVTAEPSGDGGPATQASFGTNDPNGLGVGPDGSVYVSARGANQVTGYIKKIDPSGIVSTVAGIPWTTADDSNVPHNEGGLATQAQVHRPRDIDVAPDGTIYFAEENNVTGRAYVRKIDPGGIVTTVAGGPTGSDPNLNQDLGEGEPALNHELEDVQALEVGPDGGIYITDGGDNVVQRVGIEGNITRVAGNGTTNATVFGQEAVNNPVYSPEGLAVLPDGDLLIRARTGGSGANAEEVIFRVDDSGLVRQAVGAYQVTPCEHKDTTGKLATRVCLDGHAKGLIAEPDGDIVFTDSRHYLMRADNPYPETGSGGIIPSPDGTETYGLSGSGRHLNTKDPLTGVTLQSFGYDSAGRLISITDGYGNETIIERDAEGRPLAIVAPGGQRTSFAIGNDGYLASIANPAGEAVDLTYQEGGLLTRFEKPSGAASMFEYNDVGRVVTATNAGGRVNTFERVEDNSSSTVTARTNGGQETVYETELQIDGDTRRSVVYPGGAEEVSLTDAAGVTTHTASDGMVTTATPGPDPRFGMTVPSASTQTLRLPSGQTRTTTLAQTATFANPDDPQSFTGQTLTTTVNGRATVLTYSRPDNSITVRSPLNRTGVMTLDANGRPLSQDRDGASGPLAPTSYAYDAQGRLVSVTAGTQSVTYAYDSANRVASSTNAAGEVTSYAYDAADRLTELELPNGQSYYYDYDVDGNLTKITHPRGGETGLGYTPDGLPASFDPPGSDTGYAWTWDQDRGVATSTGGGGRQEQNTYDATKRFTGFQSPTGSTTLGYSDDTTRATELTRTVSGGPSSTLGLTYDGPVVTEFETTGATESDLDLTFNNDLRLTSTNFTSGADIVNATITRDNDGLVTGVGPFTFNRSGPGGTVSAVSAANLSSARSHDALGRMNGRTHTVNSSQVYDTDYSYDTAGRLVTRTEAVVGEAARTFDYGYDASGRLLQVRENGTVTESYSYDSNGNRTSATGTQASFNEADQLQARGSIDYEYNADGYLSQRGTDGFEYSTRGDLIRAEVDDQEIRYGYDAFGRRVTRTVDGGAVREYFYANPGNPFQLSAVRDENGIFTYLWYDDQDLLIALDRDGSRYFVATDQVGSPRVVTDSAGAVVKKVRYTAFGVQQQDTVPGFDLPIGYAGGIPDELTNLVRFGLRDYEPSAGRWTARDPGLHGASATNLYSYVDGDPIAQRDPTGLDAVTVGFSYYAAAGGGAKVSYGYTNGEFNMSVCGEFGVGAGGGISAEFSANVPKTGASAFVEASAKFGLAKGSAGLDLSLDCFEVSSKAGVGVGPLSIETTGKVKLSGKGPFPKSDFGGGVQAKAGIKGCYQLF